MFLGVLQFAWNVVFAVFTLLATFAAGVFSRVRAMLTVLFVGLAMLYLYEYEARLFLELKEEWNSGTGSVVRGIIYIPLDLLREVIQAVLPIYNLVVWCSMQVLRVLVFGATADGESFLGTVASLADMTKALVESIVDYSTTLEPCARVNNVTDAACYEAGLRQFDLQTPLTHLGVAITFALRFIKSNCGSLAGILNVMLYPFTDRLFIEGVHSLANAPLYAVVQAPLVTWERSQQAVAGGKLAGVLKSPDLNPIFDFAASGARKVGKGLDNWLDIVALTVEELFFGTAPTCPLPSTEQDLPGPDPDLFGARETRVVSLTEGMYAITDGVSVEYVEYQRGVQRKVAPRAWPFEVDVRMGIAAVRYSEQDESDNEGGGTTAMFGCACYDVPDEDTYQGTRLELSCAILPFTEETSFQIVDYLLPTRFHVASTSGYATCNTMTFSVQSVRWPLTRVAKPDVSRLSPALYNTNNRFSASDVSDWANPRVVDAVVWATPRCDVSGSFSNYVCTPGFVDAGCYPYCLAARPAASGNSVLTFYNANEWDEKVQLLQRFCDPTATLYSADAPPEGGWTASTVFPKGDLAGDGYSTATTPVEACVYNREAISIVDKARLPGETAPSSALLDEQPYVFAGDAALFIDRSAGELYVKRLYGSENWQMTVDELPRRIGINAPCLDASACPREVSPDPRKVTVSDGFAASPGAATAAVATRWSVFHVVNPSAEVYSEYFNFCRLLNPNTTGTTGFQVTNRASYSKPRVWRIDAFARDLGLVDDVEEPRVPWSAEFDGYDGKQSTLECSTPRNMSIVSISYINERNVALTLLEASPAYFNPVTQRAYLDAPEGTGQAKYVLYYLDPLTMQFRRHRLWTDNLQGAVTEGVLCPELKRMPTFGSMLGEATVAAIEAIRMPANALLSIPVLKDLEALDDIRSCPLVTRGHSLLRECGTSMFSLDRFFEALLNANGHFWRAFSYISVQLQGSPRAQNGRVLLNGISVYYGSTRNVISQAIRKRAMDAFQGLVAGDEGGGGGFASVSLGARAGVAGYTPSIMSGRGQGLGFGALPSRIVQGPLSFISHVPSTSLRLAGETLGFVGAAGTEASSIGSTLAITTPGPMRWMLQGVVGSTGFAWWSYNALVSTVLALLSSGSAERTPLELIWSQLYDARADFRVKVTHNSEKACTGMLLLFGGDGAIAEAALAFCSAGVYAADGFLEMLSVVTVDYVVMDCVCGAPGGVELSVYVEEYCLPSAPEAYGPAVRTAMSSLQADGGPQDLCAAVVEQANDKLLHAFDLAFAAAYDLAEASAGVFQQVIDWMPGDQGSCRGFYSSPELVTIMPTPMDYWRVCGNTTACHMRCTDLLQAFDSEQERDRTFGVKTSEYTTLVEKPYIRGEDLLAGRGKPPFEVLAMSEPSDCAEVCGHDMDNNTVDGYVREARCVQVVGVDQFERLQVVLYCVPSQLGVGIWRKGNWSVFGSHEWTTELVDVHFSTNVVREDAVTRSLASPLVVVLKTGVYLYSEHGLIQRLVRFMQRELVVEAEVDTMHIMEEILVRPGVRPIGNAGLELDAVVLLKGSTATELVTGQIVDVAQCNLFSFTASAVTFSSSSVAVTACPDSSTEQVLHHTQGGNRVPVYISRDLSRILFLPVVDGVDLVVCDSMRDFDVHDCVTSTGIANPMTDAGLAGVRGTYGGVQSSEQGTTFRKSRAVSTTCMLETMDETKGTSSFGIFSAAHGSEVWFAEVRVVAGTADRIPKSVGRSTSSPQPIVVTNARDCNTRSCSGCNSLHTQKVCYAAQQCIISKCIGTPVNFRTPLCAWGGIIKEMMEASTSTAVAVWFSIYETVALVVNGQTGVLEDKVYIAFPHEAISMLLCEAKDLVTVVVASITSMVSSAIFLERTTADLNAFSPEATNEMIAQTTMATAALTAMFSHMGQLPLYLAFAVVQMLTCTVNDIAMVFDFTGKEVRFGKPETLEAFGSVGGQCVTVLVADEAEQASSSQDSASRLAAAISDASTAAANTYVAADGWKHGTSVISQTAKMGYKVSEGVTKYGVKNLRFVLNVQRGLLNKNSPAYAHADRTVSNLITGLNRGARNAIAAGLAETRQRIGQLRAGGRKTSKFVSSSLASNTFAKKLGTRLKGAGDAISARGASLGKGLQSASRSAARKSFAGTKGLLGRALGRPLRSLMMAPMKTSMHLLDAGMAWMIGLVRTVQDVIQSADRQHCKLPDATGVDIPTCACGDDAAVIPDDRSTQRASEGALWCAGTMDLVQSDGSSHIVFNPYSLSELKTYMGTADEYMTCVSDASGEDCDSLRPTAPALESQGADLLAVVTRCRSNYVNKQWDAGAAFVFAPELIIEFTGFAGTIISYFEEERFPESVVECMFLSIENNLPNAACLDLYLSALGQTADEYFTYDMHETGYAHTLADTDACEVFTGPAKTSDLFAQCVDQVSSTFTANDDTEDVRECDLEYFLWSGRSSNKVPLATGHFKAHREMEARAVMAQQMITDEQKRMTIVFDAVNDWNASELDLVFFTADGDGLHQAMDCLIMGPYAGADLWPGPSDVMSALRYSRATDPSDFEQLHRNIKAPCGSADDIGDDDKPPFTCGSPARKAVLKSFVRDNLDLGDSVERLVKDKIQELRDYWLQDSIGGCREVVLQPDGTVSYSVERDLQYCSVSYVGEWTSYLDEETTATPVNGDGILGAVLDKMEHFALNASGALLNDTSNVIRKHYASGGLASETDLTLTAEQMQQLLSYGLFDPTQVTTFYGLDEVMKPLSSSLLDTCTAHLSQFLSTHPMQKESEDKWVLLGMKRAGAFDPMAEADYTRFASKLEETMHHYALEAWYTSPFYWSYVTRFVPSDSLVCRNHVRSHDTRAAGSIALDASRVPVHNVLQLAEIAAGLQGDYSPVFAKYGFLSGTIGELHGGTCVCGWHVDEQPDVCTIPNILCDAASEWGYVDVEVVCAENRTYDVNTEAVLLAVYDLLRNFYAEGQELSEACVGFGPSDRWGMQVDAASVDSWLRGEVFDLPLPDIISEGRGGMRLGSLHAVARRWSTVLHEGARTVPVVHPSEAARGTTVAQRTCENDVTDAFSAEDNLFTARYIDELFPLAHVIQENLPAAHCSRFAIELGRKHFMDILSQNGALDDTLEEQGDVVVLWRERCRAQLGVVAMCQLRGAYAEAPPPSGMDMRLYLKPNATHDSGLHWARVWGHLEEDEAEAILESVRAGLQEELLGDTPSSMQGDAFFETLTSQTVVPGLFNSKQDGSDWRTAEGVLQAEHCDAVFDWWPEDQPEPIGYHVTVSPFHDEAGYRGFDNGFMVERDGGFVFVHYEHSALRNETLASNHYGASGYCGIHSAGMDMRKMNRMRVCTSMGTETKADPTVPVAPTGGEAGEYYAEQCSPTHSPLWDPNTSPLVRHGAGLLNFWDGRELYDWPPTDGIGESVQEALPPLPAFDEVGFGPECPFLSLVTCTADADCVSVNPGQQLRCLARGHFEDGTRTWDLGVCATADVECVNHEGCGPRKMCAGDGKCVAPVLVFRNELDAEINAQVFAETCPADGTTQPTDMWGASLFQDVSDALPSLGMCSYRNWFEYVSLITREETTSDTCSTADVTCNVQARTATIQHTGATTQPTQGSLWKEGRLLVSPSPCDRDYMHLQGMHACHPAPGKMMAESDIINEDDTRDIAADGELGWAFATHRAGGHLPLPTFTGFRGDAYFFTGSTEPLSDLYDIANDVSKMKRCVEIAQCTLQEFKVNGVTVPARKAMSSVSQENPLNPESPSVQQTEVDVTLKDVFTCGPFGLVSRIDASDGTVQSCILDPAVAGLWYAICATSQDTLADECLTANENFNPCFRGNGNSPNLPYYNPSDWESVHAIVNGLFLYFETGVLIGPNANMQKYAKTIKCTESLFESLRSITEKHAPSYSAASSDPDGPFIKNEKPLGLYYATEYALTEFPFAWWVMCTLFQNIHPTADGVVQCDAWEERFNAEDIPDGHTTLFVLQRVEGGISNDELGNILSNVNQINADELCAESMGGDIGPVAVKMLTLLRSIAVFEDFNTMKCYDHREFDLAQHDTDDFMRVMEEYLQYGNLRTGNEEEYTIGAGEVTRTVAGNRIADAICRQWVEGGPVGAGWAVYEPGALQKHYSLELGVPVVHYSFMSKMGDSINDVEVIEQNLEAEYDSQDCNPNAPITKEGGTFCVYKYRPTDDPGIARTSVVETFENAQKLRNVFTGDLPRAYIIAATSGSDIDELQSIVTNYASEHNKFAFGTIEQVQDYNGLVTRGTISYLDVCDANTDKNYEGERCFIGDGENNKAPCDEAYDATLLNTYNGGESIPDSKVKCVRSSWKIDGTSGTFSVAPEQEGPICLSAYSKCLPALSDVRYLVVPVGIRLLPYTFAGAVNEDKIEDLYRKQQTAWCPHPAMMKPKNGIPSDPISIPMPGFDSPGEPEDNQNWALGGFGEIPQNTYYEVVPETLIKPDIRQNHLFWLALTDPLQDRIAEIPLISDLLGSDTDNTYKIFKEWSNRVDNIYSAALGVALGGSLTNFDPDDYWITKHVRRGTALISTLVELGASFLCGKEQCRTDEDQIALEVRKNVHWCGTCTQAPRHYCTGANGCRFHVYNDDDLKILLENGYDAAADAPNGLTFQRAAWAANILVASKLKAHDYHYHMKPDRARTPYFGATNLEHFSEFDSTPASSYLASISAGDAPLSGCARQDVGYNVLYNRCSNNEQLSVIHNTVEKDWKIDAFVRVPPKKARAMQTTKEQMLGHTVYGFAISQHELAHDFMSWVTNGSVHCPHADIHTSICIDEDTRPVLLNPWTGGDFNPVEFCDTPAFPDYGGLRIDAGCNSFMCPNHHVRGNRPGEDPFHQQMAAQCRERDGDTPTAQLPIPEAKTNLCRFSPQSNAQCTYAQGTLGGDGAHSADGAPVESLYQSRDASEHKQEGGILGTESNPLLRGHSRRYAGFPSVRTAAVAPGDIGGHAIRFNVDAKGEMRVDKMLLESYSSTSPHFDVLAHLKETRERGSIEWLQNYEAVLDAERADAEVPNAHQTDNADGGPVHWACPYRRLAYWGGYANEKPVLPDPRRTRRLFGPVNRESSVHPMQSIHEATWATRWLYTANGVCFCSDPLDCSFGVNDTNPCSLKGGIAALYDRQAYTATQLSPECTEQLDWPFTNGKLRDGSDSRPAYEDRKCSLSKRLPPFRVRYEDTGFAEGLYGQTTSAEGGDCHTGHMAQHSGQVHQSSCRLAHKNTTHMAFHCERGVHVEVLRERAAAPAWVVDQLKSGRRKCSEADNPPQFRAAGEPADAASSFGRFMRVSPERYVSGDLARTACNALGLETCEWAIDPSHWEIGSFLRTLLTDPAALFNASAMAHNESVAKGFAAGSGPVQADDPAWDSPWVACKVGGDGTMSCNGTIAREEWADPSLRSGACKRVLQEHNDNDLAMDLEICNLDSTLAELCRQIANMRATIRTANCVAAGACFNQYFFYYPGTYSVTNDEFVHDSVRKFYLLRDADACPLTQAQSTLVAQNNEVRYRCAATQLEPVVVTLEYLRLTLQKLVRIAYYIAMIVIKFLEMIPTALSGGETGQRILRILEEILLYLQLLVEEIKDMIDQMGNFVLEVLLRSPWGEKLRTIIYEMCKMLNLIIDMIKTVICPVLKAVHWFVKAILTAFTAARDVQIMGVKPLKSILKNPVRDLQAIEAVFAVVAECAWAKTVPCDRIETETGTEDGTLPTPTRCWTQYVATLGDESMLSCTGADTCELEDGTRVVCDQCPLQSTGIMDYGCDPFRKVCKCGVPVNEKTPCTAHYQCLDDSESQCVFMDTGSQQTFGTDHCANCATRAMCVLHDGGVSGHCSCPLQHTSFESCQQSTVGAQIEPGALGLCLTVLAAGQQSSGSFTTDYGSTAAIPCRLVERSRSYCYRIHLSATTFSKLILARDYFSVGSGRRLLQEEKPLEWDDVSGVCQALMRRREEVGEQGMAVTDYFAMQECAKWRGVAISLIHTYNLTGIDDHFLLSVSDFVHAVASPHALLTVVTRYQVVYEAFKHSKLAMSLHRMMASVERVANAWLDEARSAGRADGAREEEGAHNASRTFFSWQRNVARFADRSLVHIPPHRERDGFRQLQNSTAQAVRNTSRRLLQVFDSQDQPSVLRPDQDPVFNSETWGAAECPIGEGLVEVLKVGGQVFVKQYSGQAPETGTPAPSLVASYPRIDKSVRVDVEYLNRTGQLMPGPADGAGEPDVILGGFHVIRGWVESAWDARTWAFTLYSTAPETLEKIMTCDLEKVVFCTAYKRTALHSLVWVLLANFLVSQGASALNVPLVARVFFWVIPLLTLFYAMEYSPFCFPIVPPCLVDEVVDLIGALVPASVLVPNALQVYPGCLDGAPPPENVSLVHNASTNASCLVSCFESPHSFYTTEATAAWWLCDMDTEACEEFGLWLHRESVPYSMRMQNFLKEKAAIATYRDPDLIAAQRFCATMTSWYLLPWALALGFAIYLAAWSLMVPVVALQGYASLFFTAMLQLHVSVSAEAKQLYNIYIQQDIRRARRDGGSYLRRRMFRAKTS